MKKFTGIMLAVILLSTMFYMNVGATTETPKIPAATEITLQSIDTEGSVNNQMTATIRLAIDGNGFNFTNANWNAKDWFENLPVENDSERNSWSVRVQSDVQTGARTMTIILTGKPTKVSDEPIRIKIPSSRIQRGTTGIPEEDTPVTLTKNLSIDVSSPTDIPFVSDIDLDFKWNIVKTNEVKLKVNNPKDGTLTATATVNGKTVTASTTSKEAEAAIYVTSDDEITFTANPASRYTIDRWTGVTLDSSEQKAKTFKRTFSNILASDIITVYFTEVPTAYRILSVPINGDGEDYTVKQEVDNEKDVTNVYTGNPATENRAEDDLIVIKFGEIAPIIIKNGDVDVKTDKKIGDTVNNYVSPIVGEYNLPYNLTIASKNTAAIKVEVVPAENTTAYKNLIAELEKYGNYTSITPGDLIITPQGAGTSTITITAKRENDTNTPKLNDGKIEFDIKVEAPATDKDFDPNTGILTATTIDIYGNPQTLELDIIKEIAKSSVSIAGYSVSGTSWTSFTINTTDTDIAKVFDKSGKSLKFTSAISGSKAAPGATIWDIGEVGARPSSPKLKVFYGNLKGTTDGDTWTVTGFDYETANKNDDTDEKGVAKLLFASSADKKTADTNTDETPEDPADDANAKFDFILFGENGLPLVKDLVDNKVVKSTYLFKLSAAWEMKIVDSEDEDSNDEEKKIYVITPASKTVKLTISSKLKPAKAKVDYKKGKVTLKAGSAYYYGDAVNSGNIESKTLDEIIDIINESETSNSIKIMTKSSTKSGILFKAKNENTINGNTLLDDISGSTSNIIYWTAADGKKPRSAATIIMVHNYRSWDITDTDTIERAFNEGSGKYKLPKGYEARLANEEKWKTSVSVNKLSFGDNTIEIRKRGNANFDVKNTLTWLKSGTNTASESESFTFTVDNYTNSKGKSKTGITGVKAFGSSSGSYTAVTAE